MIPLPILSTLVKYSLKNLSELYLNPPTFLVSIFLLHLETDTGLHLPA